MLIPYKKCVEIYRAIYGISPKNVLHIGAHLGEEAASYEDNGVLKVVWFEANPKLAMELKKSTYKATSGMEPWEPRQAVVIA